MNYFITGTDTGVGKTYVTCLLVRALRKAGLDTAAMKPICCGERTDATLLREASGGAMPLDDTNPVWLRTPAAPYACVRAGEPTIDFGRIRQAFARLRASHGSLLVEGVGGWRTPITRDSSMARLARDFDLPVLVVARNRLGALNHTLLTVERILSDGLKCGGVILNSMDPVGDGGTSTNRAILEELLEVPILFEIGPCQEVLSLAIA